LDLNDLSEIQPALVKLKAVIRAVPRMERFIAQVTSFVFEREGEDPDRHSVEDVLPMLEQWWRDVQVAEELSALRAGVQRVLSDHEKAMAMAGKENDVGLSESNRRNDSDSDSGAPHSASFHSRSSVSSSSSSGMSIENMLQAVSDLAVFRLKALRDSKALANADEYLASHPNEILTQITAHIKYMFGVKTLDGLLPRLNRVYLFNAEMTNFLTAAREMFSEERERSHKLRLGPSPSPSPSSTVLDPLQTGTGPAGNATLGTSVSALLSEILLKLRVSIAQSIAMAESGGDGSSSATASDCDKSRGSGQGNVKPNMKIRSGKRSISFKE
jgi:hypothetical protein